MERERLRFEKNEAKKAGEEGFHARKVAISSDSSMPELKKLQRRRGALSYYA